MKRVLLLDDNPIQLCTRQMVLTRGKIESDAATTAQSALALLRSPTGKETIGAVITDHLMPGMDGVEFVRELRTFNKEMPVIVISGLPDADAAYTGMNVIFRQKPCEPEELIALVRSTLTDPRYRATA